jgi:hypothetical protein
MATSQTLIEHRVNALAYVFLTRLANAEVTSVEWAGLDLLIRFLPDEKKYPELQESVLSVGCILKGTSLPMGSISAANKYLLSATRVRDRQQYFFPVLTLLFSMVDDTGYYAWHAEPVVSNPGQPVLIHPAKYECSTIDEGSLDAITGKIVQWYNRLSQFLVQA